MTEEPNRATQELEEPAPGEEASQDRELEETEEAEAPAAVGDTAATGEAELEKAMEKLRKEAARNAAAIARIMGEDAQELELCPLCWDGTPGFRWPHPPEGEQLDRVLEALGIGGAAAYVKAPDALPCETCAALGRVLTGSKVPEHLTKMCPNCNGTGFRLVPGPPAGNGAAVVTLAPSPVPDLPEEPPPDADPWGRRPGDPNFGVLPQFVGRR